MGARCMSCGEVGKIKHSEWEPTMKHVTCKCGASTTLTIPDGNVHTVPNDAFHIESVQCWCVPELIGDYKSTDGVEHYLHKGLQ